MDKPESVTRYGIDVWENVKMDILRKEECLCLHCGHMKGCPSAKILYEVCCTRNMAMAITRCPAWGPQEGS